jgi:type V secretory pathway adhesin AidA
VSVDVYNGTKIGRLSATTGVQLKAAGFGVHRAGLNWPTHNLPRTMIQYPASQAAGARLLARVLPGAALQIVAGLPRIRLVLGASGHTVAGVAAAGTAPTARPTPAATGGLAGQPRTAAQAACR